MTGSVCQSAPAKLNLTLQVLGRRPDGYHQLESLVAFAPEIADTVTLSPGASNLVTFSGPFSAGLDGGPTTVSKALRLLSRTLATSLQLGDVAVDKHIPLASGLGGGSADAAALLRAVQLANAEHQSEPDWLEIARQIGADVPVCLQSCVQVMSGIGEVLTPVPALPEIYAVLINPNDAPVKDKTRRVFQGLGADPGRESAGDRSKTGTASFSTTVEISVFVRAIGNDLIEPARALMPALNAPLKALHAQRSCLATSLTGAGPTVFGLFADRGSAETALREIKKDAPTWWVKSSKLV